MTVQHCNSNIVSYTMGRLLGTLCKTMQQDAIRAEPNPSGIGAHQLGRSDGGLPSATTDVVSWCVDGEGTEETVF
jgi:hypothetical protein